MGVRSSSSGVFGHEQKLGDGARLGQGMTGRVREVGREIAGELVSGTVGVLLHDGLELPGDHLAIVAGLQIPQRGLVGARELILRRTDLGLHAEGEQRDEDERDPVWSSCSMIGRQSSG